MTLNNYLKSSGLQYTWDGEKVIIRLPDGRGQDRYADELYKLLWQELKLPYYWYPRPGCMFCVVVPFWGGGRT
ncbi:hypothetical protein [Synechocystis sp. LKSZ1]|uniref:hypothetical protein n=1 Tax=Synechocystis sp. LKSZ1 TaxID=3144951 RepID=UPI00336C1310